MPNETLQYSLPEWRITRWLTRTPRPVSESIRIALIESLYGSLAIFYAAALCTLTIAIAVWLRHQGTLFAVWIGVEIVSIGFRVFLLNRDRRAAAEGRKTETDLYLTVTFIWAATLGYGTAITLASGDWIAATAIGAVTTSIAGGMCLRYFAAPRYVTLVASAVLLPMAVSALFSGHVILVVLAVQTPLFLFSMSRASMRLNRMMLTTMEAEESHARRAMRDGLTGLANRDGLRQIAERRGQRAAPRVLFFLDLDGFKPVNDRLGHAAGDAVLIEVAKRLRRIAGDGGSVARIGGDEFVVLDDAGERRSIERRGRDIVSAIAARPYEVNGQTVQLGVSVGAARLGRDVDLDAALARADVALYQVKADGGRNVRLAA